MKKKNISKKVLAVFLSIVIIAMSVPFTIVGSAAGLYDPAPYFDDAAIEEGARAWVDDDGNIPVVFPSATAQPAYNGEPLSIAFYILELVDMGAKNASHTKVVLDTIKVNANARARTNSATFSAADIGDIDLENKRYSVTVTAVDSENWFSQSIYTTVTDVPTFIYDAERYQVFTADTTAAREIMTFDSGSDDGAVSGGVLQYLGPTPQTGVENASGVDTYALRFKMYQQPTSTQTFDTSYSRQTWDFRGADEVWYWMDLTDVELTGLSFRLRTNEKLRAEWKSAKVGDIDEYQRAGDIVYSTKGTAVATYTGESPYVWVQREDGGWNKVMLKDDGTLDIGNFKGYIRVPLDFICSETASYVDISNQEFNTGKNFIGSWWALQKEDAFAWMKTMTFSQKVLVDNAGTCISDALLIQRRAYKTSSGVADINKNTFTWNINGQYHNGSDINSVNDFNYSQVGYMLAMPLDNTKVTTSVTTGNVSTDRAYVANGAVQNREGGLKAIEDIYNAGFSIEGCSADSLSNSFYLDNVVFYRSDGEQWTDLALSGYGANTGEVLSNYYDQETEISIAIFDAVDQYISSPDWADYRELEYILGMIDGYKAAIEEANNTSYANSDTKISTDFLSFENLAAKASSLGRDSWQKAQDAYLACVNAETIEVATDGTIKVKANAEKDDLVPLIVNQMEKLPAPENVTAVSDALRDAILELWRTYSLLNLGQLEMLGGDEELKILQYVALLDGIADINKEDFIVGQSLADRPFILFNGFENYELGTQSVKLEEAQNMYNNGDSDTYTDYRYTKSLLTYAPENFEDFAGKGSDTTNNIISQLITYQPTKNGFRGGLKTKASWATITNQGFQGSNGATMTIDSQFYSSGEGVYNVLSTTYMGAEAANIDALRATGTGNASVKLGSLAKSFSNVAVDPYLSLVFYVDFTQISDFNMSVTIQSYFDDTLNDFQINMGTNAADQNFFILDPVSGEWAQANNAENAGRMFAFTSKAGADRDGDGTFDITLANYKGYVRIPLYHFKPGNNGQKLDESELALNNIYRISIGIAPGSSAGATEMDGRSYVIDNIGFTYDPVAYSDGVAVRAAAGVTDPYFDEFFGAKSLPAANFEKLVDEIDPYEKSTLQAEVVSALAIYNKLSAYQQALVQQEKDTLDLYLQYVAGTNSLPKPTYTPEQFATFVDSLPEAIKTAAVTGEYDIPYPGFANGAVNYEAMGITRELADEIITYYQESYTRYSKTQKASIPNATEFLTAYNMCMRMTQTLEDIKDDAVAFLPNLTSLYERKTDDEGNVLGNFVSIEGREEVQTFWDTEYFPLQYYSKTSIDDGSIYANLTNTSRGLTYFLKNTETYTIDGEVIRGGLLNYQDKMQNIYDTAKDHIDNKTLFTAEEFEDMRDVLQEYNAFLQAYYNIEELYELEQKILDLFHVVDTQMGETDLMMSEEATSASTSYTISYVEYLDLNDETASQPLYIRLKTSSENGVLTDAFGNTMGYTLTMGPHTVDASTINAFTDAEWRASYPIINNTLTEASPGVYNITASVTQEQIDDATLLGAARDEVTLEFVSSDGIVLDSHVIYISYSSGDSYIVEIPAELPVEWDDSTPQDVSYSVTTEMNAAATLLVGVTNDGTGKLKNSVTDDTLNYEVENFAEIEFGYRVTDAKPDPAPTVTVSGWDDVPVGEYRTTLTYTVVYDDGSDDGTT